MSRAVNFRNSRLRLSGSLTPLADPAAFQRYLEPLRKTEWVVYSKPPFDGPARVLDYLGRYTHRVAISNERILAIDDGCVRFRWKDYRQQHRLRTMTLTAGGVHPALSAARPATRLPQDSPLRFPCQPPPPPQARPVPAPARHASGRARGRVPP